MSAMPVEQDSGLELGSGCELRPGWESQALSDEAYDGIDQSTRWKAVLVPDGKRRTAERPMQHPDCCRWRAVPDTALSALDWARRRLSLQRLKMDPTQMLAERPAVLR